MSSTSQTQHALYMFTRTFDKYKHESFLNLATYSDGIPFAYMLSSIQQFGTIVSELDIDAEKWTQKLANLKKLLIKMESYVEKQSEKSLKINDIELVQIAKNSSQQQILKFFQVVIAVLMQTAQKQDYIQIIMGLDERSQQALVIVVQNAMEYRISDNQNRQQTNPKHSIQQITQLQNENHILTQQINELGQQNESLQKQVSQLKQKLHEYHQQIQKARNFNIQMYMKSNNNKTQTQRQNSLIQTLKRKMLDMTRDNQIEISKLNDDIYHLKSKLVHYKEIQDQLIQRNKVLQDRLKSQGLQLQMQRKKNEKIIQQKQIKLKKYEYELQIAKNKIQQLSQDIQVNDLNLRMQLQKKQVRFKQLQKQVKTRLIQPNLQLSAKKISVQENRSPLKDEQNMEQLQYLKVQVQKLRNSNRQLQRENIKMKKRGQKLQTVQNQKKKLQKIILDVSKCRDSEIQMLVVSLYDLRNQNIRMHEIITQFKVKYETKAQ